jgi:hypothetical protein
MALLDKTLHERETDELLARFAEARVDPDTAGKRPGT